MRRNRFLKRPFALALSLCILFSAFGQISYAGDSAETEPVTQVIDEASSNPNSSSEPGTQSQGGQDENVPDDSAAGGDTSGDDQTDGDNPGGDSTEIFTYTTDQQMKMNPTFFMTLHHCHIVHIGKTLSNILAKFFKLLFHFTIIHSILLTIIKS